MRFNHPVSLTVFVMLAVVGGASCGLLGGDEQPQPDPRIQPVPVPDPQPQPGPAPQPIGPKPKVGGCRNEHLEGTCKFFLVTRAPGQSDRDPPGHTVYRVIHEIQPEGEERKIELNSAHLLVPDDKVEALRKYYKKHSPRPCTAYIVRPPCNPQGTSVGLNLDPPPFAKVVRF